MKNTRTSEMLPIKKGLDAKYEGKSIVDWMIEFI